MSAERPDPIEDAVARALYAGYCQHQSDENRKFCTSLKVKPGKLTFADFDRTPELWPYWHGQARIAIATYRSESGCSAAERANRNSFRKWLEHRGQM